MPKIFLLAFMSFATIIGATAAEKENPYSAYQAGNYSKAVQLYSDQIQINNQYAPILFNRALAFMRLENFQDAINDLSKVIKIEPNNADAYYAITLAYSRIGDHDKALDYIEQAEELDIDNPKIAYAKANIYYMLEDDNNSVSAYNRVMELDPNNAMAYYGRAVAYKYMLKNDLAKEDFMRFLQYPNLPEQYISEAKRMLEAIKIEEDYY